MRTAEVGRGLGGAMRGVGRELVVARVMLVLVGLVGPRPLVARSRIALS